ncbi:MAG: MarR family winged helix-turn-helix transcriptional regulator [Sporichthyaceae bacterium]
MSRPQFDVIDWARSHWVDPDRECPAQFAAMISLLRATAMLTEEIDRVLKTVGLTRTAYLVLMTLQMSPQGASPLGQLGKALLVHPTTVTVVIDGLEQSKLVVREPHPSDRRTVLAKLTKKGTTSLQRANKALEEIGFGMAKVDDATADRITTDLHMLRHALGDPG